MIQTIVKEYKKANEYQRDATEWACLIWPLSPKTAIVKFLVPIGG